MHGPKKLGQVDMFTGRVRKVPPPKERNVHIAIADTLQIGCKPEWLWTHFPAGELRTDVTGSLLKRMGLRPAGPTSCWCRPSGARLHALEVKRKGMKPNREQMAFLDALEQAGGRTAWVDDVRLGHQGVARLGRAF